MAARTPRRAAEALRSGWRPADFRLQGFRDPAQSAAVRDRAAGWVEEYLGRVDPRLEPVGVERTVSTPTAGLVVSGRVDRIDDRPGTGLVVVDYKTGRRTPDQAQARSSLALALYAVAARRTLHRACTRVELHHLPTGTVTAAEHDDASLDRKVAEAESIARDCAGADRAYQRGERGDDRFPPRPSTICSWCDWRRHCPQGRAAAPDLDPWVAVDPSGG